MVTHGLYANLETILIMTGYRMEKDSTRLHLTWAPTLTRYPDPALSPRGSSGHAKRQASQTLSDLPGVVDVTKKKARLEGNINL
jgi:hypothetical protein